MVDDNLDDVPVFWLYTHMVYEGNVVLMHFSYPLVIKTCGR